MGAVRSEISTANEESNSKLVEQGKWLDSGGQNPKSLQNPHYIFQVSEAGLVTVKLHSEIDTYLYLLHANGKVIAQNDDGDGANSKIVRRLTPGLFTVVAATVDVHLRGDFKLELEGPVEKLQLEGSAMSQSDSITLEVQGSWFNSGGLNPASRNNPRFILEVTDHGNVTIDLQSTADNQLYLLDNENRILSEDDDSGAGSNAWISTMLAPGRYTIVAATVMAGMKGTFRLAAAGPISSLQPKAVAMKEAERTGKSAAGDVLIRNTRGSWFNSGGQNARSPNNPRYAFDVLQRGNLIIDLTSSVDTYLFLLDNDGQVIDENDDGGRRGNSRLMRRLRVGSYSVVAATSRPRKKGAFHLKIQGPVSNLRSVAPAEPEKTQPTPSQSSTSESSTTESRTAPAKPDPPSTPSMGNPPPNAVTIQGEWNDSAADANSRKNPRYTFQVNRAGEVTVDLVSESVDTYLYLLNSQRKIIASNDDYGDSTNSRIVRGLSPGIYSAVAATSRSGQEGKFAIYLQGPVSHLRELIVPPPSVETQEKPPSQAAKPADAPSVDATPVSKPETVPQPETISKSPNAQKLEAKIRELERQTLLLQKENSDLQKNRTEWQSQLENTLANEKNVYQEVAELKQQMQLFQKFKELEQTYQSLLKERENLKKEENEARKQIEISNARSQSARSELQELRQQLEQLTEMG